MTATKVEEEKRIERSMEEEREKRHYYQAIARHFFLERGGPFLLSARDLEVIAKWEAMGIPLPVVLEGIDRAVEKRKKRRRPLKFFSLLWCDLEVQRAFRQHQDRLVGKQKEFPSQDKRLRVIAALEEFLKDVPPPWHSLKPIIIKAKEIYCQRDIKNLAARLEFLEEEVDRLLLAGAAAEEKQDILAWVEKEFPAASSAEKEELLQTALLKSLREKYRIPHLLTCYY